MEDNLKAYIKTNAFLGFNINVNENIGDIHCPTLNEINKDIYIYLYFVNKFIELYDDDKENFFNTIINDKNLFVEFANLLSYFINNKDIKFSQNKFIYKDNNFIDGENYIIFMNTIKILHQYDKKDDDYKPANKIAAEMMARAKKLKKDLEIKQKNKNGVGFLEITSTVSARHPSINPSNIQNLNYYQIIDQYKRLMKIDDYMPCLYGNATEDYVKKIKHYSCKLIND